MSETNIPNPNPTFPINNKPIGTRLNQPLVAFTVVPLSSHTLFMAYIFSRAAQNTWKGVLLPRDYCSCTVVGTSCSATSIAMLRARRTALLTLQFVHTQTLRPFVRLLGLPDDVIVIFVHVFDCFPPPVPLGTYYTKKKLGSWNLDKLDLMAYPNA